MGRIRGLAQAQKIVLVVAMAVVLFLVGMYVATGGFAGPRGGWFGYAPPTDTYFVVRHYSVVRTLVVPVALVAVWAALSIWVLAPQAEQPGQQDPQRPAE